MYIKFVHNTFSFREHFDTVLTEEIRTAKFCQEVFVMPKHLMTKLNIPESPSYMSQLREIVKSQQYCGINVIWQKNRLFTLLLVMRPFTSWRCLKMHSKRKSIEK